MPYYTMPDQQRLFVREIGRGRPVLILSGLGMSSWQWLPFIANSLAHRKFYIPDFRGFGRSKDCQIPTDADFASDAIASHWRDVACLIEHISAVENLEHGIDLIAYSMGATTAMHGMKYGNFSPKIKRYIHIDQSPCIRNQSDWQFGLYGDQQAIFLDILDRLLHLLTPYRQLHQPLKQLPQHIKQQLLPLFDEFVSLQKVGLPQHKSQKMHSQRLTIFEQIAQSNIAKTMQLKLLPFHSVDYLFWYLNSYRQHQHDYRAALFSLTSPAHFLIGKNSVLYPAQGQIDIAHQLSDAKLHIFEGAGHALVAQQPIRFSRLIYQLLLD